MYERITPKHFHTLFHHNSDMYFYLYFYQQSLSQDYIVESLPTKVTTLDVMSITWILSQLGTNALGDFEEQFAFDPTSLHALDRYVYHFCFQNS